ncbi:MAG: phosphohistidine phosphatase SixA [Verrucomicrobiota bacterium]
MRIYFVRHAEAEDGFDDAARQLTDKGRKQARLIGRFLANAGIEFDTAFSSPLVRAVETAKLILPLTNQPGRPLLAITQQLLNEVAPRVFDAWLRSQAEHEHILLVGHNPSMTEQVARLLGMQSPFSVNLAKGALAMVEWEPPTPATLKLFISPKVLR